MSTHKRARAFGTNAYSSQISEPATSVWDELHRTVRTSDINKVDDCRDDIDTLLVFVRKVFLCETSTDSLAQL